MKLRGPTTPADALRWLCLAVAALALVWAYWPTFADMERRWSIDPQYSHGFLVPVFAAVLLAFRGRQATGALVGPASWWGLLILLAGVGLRFVGVYYYFSWFDGLSLLPTLAGLVLLMGGWPLLRWSWPAIGFLVFMLPLPFRVETALSQPLRRAATEVSSYALQTLGFPALAEGNTILLNDFKMGVEEACSGLSMLMTFFALTTAVAALATRPLADRVGIVLSAVPIAIVANVTRITATGIAHEWISGEFADAIFHRWAGWFMMPLALILLWLEIKCLDFVFVKRAALGPKALEFGEVR